VSILFEDPCLLKAQLFLLPHDKVSDPKSVHIGILNYWGICQRWSENFKFSLVTLKGQGLHNKIPKYI
jgi:hypothetical protein